MTGITNFFGNGKIAFGQVLIQQLFLSFQSWNQDDRLVSPTPGSGDYMAESCAISGDGSTIVVGVPREDLNGFTNVGCAFVFTKTNGTWSLAQTLQHSDQDSHDNFGKSVAISDDGSCIAVARPGDNNSNYAAGRRRGKICIFNKDGATWTEQVALGITTAQEPDSVYDSYLGTSLALSGDGTTVVACPEGSGQISHKGVGYIFRKIEGTWSYQQRVLATDALAGDYMGGSPGSAAISSDGSVVLLGAHRADINSASDDNAGSAHVFVESVGVWSQQQTLLASDRAPGDNFGSSVSISDDGNNIVITAVGKDVLPGGWGQSNTGGAYVFSRTAGVWSEVQLIHPTTPRNDVGFGNACSISGDGRYIVVGAYISSNPEQSDGSTPYVGAAGQVYIFNQTDGVWSQLEELVRDPIVASTRFGNSVSISNNGSDIVAGAYLDTVDALSQAGAAYVFSGQQ